DPAKNDWNLDGGDAVPPRLENQGYGAEVRWDVSLLGLQPGRIYRLYFMVHDGDQNKDGGDVGQGCAIVTMNTNVTVDCPNPPEMGTLCPHKADFWKKNPNAWPAPYSPDQTVVSVFEKASLYPTAANKTLLEAVDGKAGDKELPDMLKEAVAALPNAADAVGILPVSTT